MIMHHVADFETKKKISILQFLNVIKFKPNFKLIIKLLLFDMLGV